MSPPSTRAQVLVIDDEASLGRSIKRALRQHDVALLESADAALARLRGCSKASCLTWCCAI